MQMVNIEQNVPPHASGVPQNVQFSYVAQVCDATDDDSSNSVGAKIIPTTISPQS